jgi:hypothetical protein
MQEHQRQKPVHFGGCLRLDQQPQKASQPDRLSAKVRSHQRLAPGGRIPFMKARYMTVSTGSRRSGMPVTSGTA